MAVEVEDRSRLSETDEVSPSEAAQRPDFHLQRGAALGRYLVIDVLGRGGMSLVYAAYDPELDRKVAIKLVRPDRDGGAEATARLLREAQAMARVLHPHVVTVHDVGTWEGRVFIAMELIDGSTLREWLTSQPRTRRQVLTLFDAAGRGLSAAHAAGLVHRDFKPDNVLVDKEDRARVTDFGLVRPAAAAVGEEPRAPFPATFEGVRTETGAVLGTPAYMAPEQLLGKVADARSDQFSFAVALYEALYGERPFEAPDFATTFHAVTRGEVSAAPPGSRVPGYLRRVLLRALAVDPAQRFGSMQALLAALARDPIARLRRLSVGLAIAVLALSGPGFGLWRARHEAHRCESTVSELDGIWDEARRAQLQRVFSGPGVRPGAWASVRAWADRYASQWKEARLTACEGDRTGRDDARLVAVSGQCLQARRLQLKAVLDLLLTSDADALELAERAFSGVGDVKACVGRLASPDAPADAPLIEQIARARARILLGRLAEGEADATEALQAARARGQRGLAAAAQLELGRAHYERAQMDEAVARYREALLGAEASGEGELGFEVRLAISQPLSENLDRYDEALWMLKEAEAIAQRLSLPADRLAALWFRQANVLEQAGRPLEAVPVAEQSLRLVRESQALPGQLPNALLSLANLHSDLGHVVTSNRYYEEYLGAEATSGLRLAEYAIPLSYSGEELVLGGEFQRGLERLQQALTVLRPEGGHAVQSALVEAWVAFAAASLGELALTEAARTRAQARFGELSEPHHVAESLQMLAWADLYQGHLGSSLRGSREAVRVLSPVSSVNRPAVLENTLGLVEAQRRLGHFEEARRALEPALAEAAKAAAGYELGLAHARVLRLGLLQDLHLAPADTADLLAGLVSIEARELGEDNPELALAFLSLGRAELERGRVGEGLAALERSLKVSERRPGDRYSIAEARFALARALAADPSTAARARALALSAHELLRALPEPTPLRAEVARWLGDGPTGAPARTLRAE